MAQGHCMACVGVPCNCTCGICPKPPAELRAMPDTFKAIYTDITTGARVTRTEFYTMIEVKLDGLMRGVCVPHGLEAIVAQVLTRRGADFAGRE